ncbi:MAG: hypothetical protein HUU08_16965 [Candidatus Brocadia sp.]|nr:hypothetical protein [Candidatus Brocadia sp.]
MKKSKWRAKRMVGLLPMVVGLLIFLTSPPAPVKADAWEKGDVFVGNSTGAYQVYDNTGNLKETINSGQGYAGTGAAFNPDQTKLYTTNFFSSTRTK